MHSTRFERTPPSPALIEQSLRGSVLQSFWVEDAPLFDAPPAFTGKVRCDLAIVGAGYTGLWTAFLAKARHPEWRVIVLEAQDPGWAASGRNGGFVESTLTHGESNGKTRYPAEYDQLDGAGLDNLDAIRKDRL